MPDALVAGTPQAVVTGNSGGSTTASLNLTGTAGGVAPYLIQFQQAPDANGSAGTFVDIGTAGAASSLVVTGLPESAAVWFRAVVSDSASPTVTAATSPQVVYTFDTFVLSLAQSSIVLASGSSLAIEVAASGSDILFDGAITLSATGLPPGVSASFSPNPMTLGLQSASSVLTLTASSDAPASSATIGVTGSSPPAMESRPPLNSASTTASIRVTRSDPPTSRAYPSFGSLIAAMISARSPASLTPIEPVPLSLAGAITLKFFASPDLVALAPRLYQAEAGDTSAMPYVVFTIRSSPTIRTTSTSLWKDAQVRFEAYASTIEAADAIAQAVSDAFKNAPLAWQGGYSIPLVPADRLQAAERKRGPGSGRVFRGMIAFSARYREDR